MRSLSKAERCIESAKKYTSKAHSYSICIFLAPTKDDEDLCTRKYKRALKHANRYIELANYYGGIR